MKNLLILFVIISFGCKSNETLIGDNNNGVSMTNLYPFKYDKLWGYADFHGNTIINPQFEEAALFSYGIALVKKDNLYGYISNKGHWKIKPKYISAETFILAHYRRKNDDRITTKSLIAKVNNGTRDIYINSNGDPPKGERTTYGACGNGRTFPRLDEYSIRNTDGTYELKYKYYKLKNDTFWHKVIDTTQLSIDTIIQLKYEFALLKKDSKYAVYSTDVSKGYDVFKNERIIIPVDSYYTVSPKFIYDDVKFKMIYGEEVPSSIYKKGDKWGIIDIRGQEMVPFIYNDIKEEKYGSRYLVEFEEEKFGYISIISESKNVIRGRENIGYKYVVREHFKRK